ncbi:hypothetical protein JXL19_04055 [bacterium]|nr:hypothetical protein [bacterium]
MDAKIKNIKEEMGKVNTEFKEIINDFIVLCFRLTTFFPVCLPTTLFPV